MRRYCTLCCFILLLPAVVFAAEDKTVADLLKETDALLQKGKLDQALKTATSAVELGPKDPGTYLVRAKIYEALDQHKEAIADYSKVIDLDAKNAEAFNRRGGEHFKLGHIKESIDDFDKFLELKPEETAAHWQRGISYYYAGRYDEGRKQFEAGQKVFADDVENAVWWYICAAKTLGADKARESILKIGKDKRVPLMAVYDLFKGNAKPEDVLKAVEEGQPAEKEKNVRLFYAHLYLGLWYESQGDKKKTLEHMTKAAEDFKQKGYMWEVARVHVELRRGEK
jgi:lipoprotein NlpI